MIGTVLVALVSARSNTASFTAPSGWDTIGDYAGSGSDRAFVFMKNWQGEASGTAITFTLAGGATNVTCLGCITSINPGGAGGANPVLRPSVRGFIGGTSTSSGNESANVPYSAYTPRQNESLLLMCWHRADDAGSPLTYGAPFTSATDFNAVASSLGSDASQGMGVVGATGGETPTITAGSVSITGGANATRISFWLEIPVLTYHQGTLVMDPGLF